MEQRWNVELDEMSMLSLFYFAVFSEEYMCGTYRYEKQFGGFWLYRTDKCSEKRNYSFICSQGRNIMHRKQV